MRAEAGLPQHRCLRNPSARLCLEAGGAGHAHGLLRSLHPALTLASLAVPLPLPPPRSKYYVNRKPRASAKFSYSLANQQRLWDLLVQQTGAEFTLG